MTLLVIILAPLAAAALTLLTGTRRRVAGLVAALLSLAPIGAALPLWSEVARGTVVTARNGLLRADALSTVLILSIAVVSALAAWLGPGMWGSEGWTAPQARRFIVFSNLFAFTMFVAVSVDNVGLMWVAIEATTIVSAIVVPLKISKASVEASWKYILIGSVGIALAFVGTVLAYFDFVHRAGATAQALNWTVLVVAAPRLHSEVLRLAFVFVLIGYGTKAGLAPMHTWLPDAHSEAPAPLSAMMSGVLLAVALYAIMRWKAVVDAAAGPAFSSSLLIAIGVLSIAIAAFSLVSQRNYKRMLAYSSIEHTGLACVGLALGPIGAFAALLHLVNHSLVKSAMFLLSGRVSHRYGTTDIGGVSGLLRAMPATGALFTVGILAVVGLPPFGLFVSELWLLRAGFATGHYLLATLVLGLLIIVFVAVVPLLNQMAYGASPDGIATGEHERLALVPIAAALVAVIALGLFIPAALANLLTMGARIVVR